MADVYESQIVANRSFSVVIYLKPNRKYSSVPLENFSRNTDTSRCHPPPQKKVNKIKLN